MPQAPMTLSQASDLIDLSIQKIFLKPSVAKTEIFKNYFNVTTGVVDYYMKDSSISGLGSAARIVESASIISEVPVQGFKQTYTQILYGKLMSFSWHMWKFGIKKRDLMRVVNELQKACSTRKEELLAQKCDAAFLTSYSASDDAGNYTVTTTGGDALALATASHTREDGGTAWSNVVSDGTTVNMNLDYPGMKAAYRVASLTVTPKGKPMIFQPTMLLVKPGTAACFRAKEIKGALKAGKIPGEFSNDGAAINDFEIVENVFLTGTGDATSMTNLSSATNWHMFDSKLKGDEYGLQYFESSPMTLDEQHVVYKTKEIQYTATEAYAYGHNDPRGTLHSTGANA